MTRINLGKENLMALTGELLMIAKKQFAIEKDLGLSINMYSAHLRKCDTVDWEILSKGESATRAYMRRFIKRLGVEAVAVVGTIKITGSEGPAETMGVKVGQLCIGIFTAIPGSNYGVVLPVKPDKSGRTRFGKLTEVDGGVISYTENLWGSRQMNKAVPPSSGKSKRKRASKTKPGDKTQKKQPRSAL